MRRRTGLMSRRWSERRDPAIQLAASQCHRCARVGVGHDVEDSAVCLLEHNLQLINGRQLIRNSARSLHLFKVGVKSTNAMSASIGHLIPPNIITHHGNNPPDYASFPETHLPAEYAEDILMRLLP